MGSPFCNRVGNNIRKYRKEKDLTLKELAEKIGLTEATAQKYESGNIKKIDIEMLKNIADALGVLPEDITGWNQEESHSKAVQGREEARVIKMYSQLTFGHKKAVQALMENLLECQQRYNSDK